MRSDDRRRSRPFRYAIEYRGKDDDFWEPPSVTHVRAKNQREALQKFRHTPLYRNHRHEMIVEGAKIDEIRRRKDGGIFGF